MRRRVRRLKATHPDRAVEVWAEDEARLGWKPITRRMWWPKGSRPRSCGRTRYEWLYVYGVVRPRTGLSFTVFQPRVQVERMAEALAAFAAHADPAGDRLLVLLVDNAGWHRAKKLAVPANVRRHFLPPWTPEWQPVAPFWVLVREGVANDTFDRLGKLRQVIRRRCRKLAADTATVFGAVGFRWAAGLEA